MNDRRKLLKRLKELARENGLEYKEDRRKGKGSHYLVWVGNKRATIPKRITPALEKAILKQLGLK